MYIPLQIRLTCFYVLLLIAALCSFGYIVSAQASKRAYNDLDATLSSRAASVRLGKALLAPRPLSTTSLLPAIAGVGSEGVAIEVLDNRLHLLATTDGNQGDFSSTFVAGGVQSPVPWDKQAAQRVLRRPFSSGGVLAGIYSTINYQGQRIRVYTLANNDYGDVHIIQTARSEQSIEHSLTDLNHYLLLGGAIFTLCAFAGGWLITLGVLARVRRITRAASSISEKRNFSQRVAEKTWRGRDELSQLAQTFNSMLDTLEQLYRYQQRFIADASHEMRAPIASINCNLDLLTKSPGLPPEEAKEALSDTQIEAERMGRLVNDLLTLARSDAAQQASPVVTSEKHLEKQKRRVDLDSLLLEVFRQYRPVEEIDQEDPARSRPRLLLQDITPAQVSGNADQLKQALVALVDNALKYTPPGGTISLSLTTEEDLAIVKVSDTGPGIAPEDIPYIFERFYRSAHARSQEQAGSGLGLAIARSLVQAHRGTIEVASTPGQGSTFTIQLPLVKVKDNP